MITGIDHIGIAVRDREQAIKKYRDILGLEFTGEETVPAQKVHVIMFKAGDIRIELLCATADDSPVAKFLEKKGEGIHHICLLVDDAAAALAGIKEKGAAVVNEIPVRGAHGYLVGFLHPSSFSGVLLELKEKKKPDPSL